MGDAPTLVPLGWLGTGTVTVVVVHLAARGTPGPVRWPGTLFFLLPQVRLAHQASLLGRLIRLLGDGGHCRYDISGFFRFLNSHTPGYVGTAMTLGKWKVEK